MRRCRLPSVIRCAVILGALAIPVLSNAACMLKPDTAAPLESQIDVLVATLDDCDEAHAISDDDALKAKALLLKLRADIAEIRRRHHGDLLDGDRSRFSARLSRIVAMVPSR